MYCCYLPNLQRKKAKLFPSLDVSESQSGQMFTHIDNYCINDLGGRSISGSMFSWVLPNGSILAYDQNSGPDSRACEAGRALDLLVNAVPKGRPHQAAYIMGDVQVFPGAAGIPWGSNGLDDIFGTVRDSNFLWSSRCLPVLKKNPVKCYAGGQVEIDNVGRLWVSNSTCIVTNDLAVNPAIDFAAVKGAYSRNAPLGTSTLLFGATDGSPNQTRYGVVNSFYSGYADILSISLNDKDPPIFYIANQTSVSAAICEIDLTEAVEFRPLNYSRADNFGKHQMIGRSSETAVNNGYGYQIQAMSNSSCEISDPSGTPLPLSSILSEAALATAAGATWPLLAENMFWDGWFDTLDYVVNQVGLRNASECGGVFHDSTNNLEDALGLATAITIGLFWGGATSVEDYVVINRGLQAHTRIRLGPSSLGA
jgi:hypothetical protein